jgi:heme a synthase
MTDARYQPWIHRTALLTACVALAPIVVGALVTTRNAGMAFPDWPTSDGWGMFTYPWLQSAGEKFLEHGHRLAGIAIGLCSIALAVIVALKEPRGWVKLAAGLVLAGVIAQGLLGAQRVLVDSRVLAQWHGTFAALVFSLMCSVATVTSRPWLHSTGSPPARSLHGLRRLSVLTTGCVIVQYVLGGYVRHRGMLLHEHLGFAFLAALMMIWLAMSAAATGSVWLRGPAAAIALLTLGQLALGAAAWVTRFGFGDYVAVYDSPAQILVCTGHVLAGMFVLGTSVVLTLRIARLAHKAPVVVQEKQGLLAGSPNGLMPGGAA